MKPNLDLLVLGGGIAGLWLAAAARRAGYRVALLESRALGAGQTLESQGIIHAGLKYALLGQVNETAELISNVAKDWQTAMTGHGAVDLRAARVASPAQHMLVPGGLLGTLAGAIGHAALGKTIQNLSPAEWPAGLAALGFKGNVIAMQEPGVEIHSVISALHAELQDVCYHYDPAKAEIIATDHGDLAAIKIGDVELRPLHTVAVAARGNEWLAEKLDFTAAAQHRPLKMVLAKSIIGGAKKDGALPHAYWHGVGGSFRPAFTISTHATRNGDAVWYIGGAVAENVEQDDALQFRETAKAIRKYLPNLDTSALEWASLPVMRIEGYDPRGWLPDRPSYQTHGNVTLAWVNKLTLAPLLAKEVLARLPAPAQIENTNFALPAAAIADNPWDHVTWQRI
jgi:glycine/D-amino acid oxidase-like deaminating enzyme